MPGLAAKPVIDCDIVTAEQDAAAGSRALTGLGFKPLGQLGIPLRWAFKEPKRLAGTSTYVVVAGSLSLRNHLAVRDILRADPDLQEQYATAKKRAGTTAANIDDYGRAKNAMVQKILAAAGLRYVWTTRRLPVKFGQKECCPPSASGAVVSATPTRLRFQRDPDRRAWSTRWSELRAHPPFCADVRCILIKTLAARIWAFCARELAGQAIAVTCGGLGAWSRTPIAAMRPCGSG